MVDNVRNNKWGLECDISKEQQGGVWETPQNLVEKSSMPEFSRLV